MCEVLKDTLCEGLKNTLCEGLKDTLYEGLKDIHCVKGGRRLRMRKTASLLSFIDLSIWGT